MKGRTVFQSTPSVGRATYIKAQARKLEQEFQSTPSVGRATLYDCCLIAGIGISIHALRGEGDEASI